MQSGFPTQSKL